MEAAIAVIPRPSLLLSHDIPSKLFNEQRFSHCSTKTSQISTEVRTIQWLPPCTRKNGFATENPEKRRVYSSAFSSKILHFTCRVICVFLRMRCNTWHVFWGKLSFKAITLHSAHNSGWHFRFHNHSFLIIGCHQKADSSTEREKGLINFAYVYDSPNRYIHG